MLRCSKMTVARPALDACKAGDLEEVDDLAVDEYLRAIYK